MKNKDKKTTTRFSFHLFFVSPSSFFPTGKWNFKFQNVPIKGKICLGAPEWLSYTAVSFVSPVSSSSSSLYRAYTQFYFISFFLVDIYSRAPPPFRQHVLTHYTLSLSLCSNHQKTYLTLAVWPKPTMPPSICLWIQTGRARYDTQKERKKESATGARKEIGYTWLPMDTLETLRDVPDRRGGTHRQHITAARAYAWVQSVVKQTSLPFVGWPSFVSCVLRQKGFLLFPTVRTRRNKGKKIGSIAV